MGILSSAGLGDGFLSIGFWTFIFWISLYTTLVQAMGPRKPEVSKLVDCSREFHQQVAELTRTFHACSAIPYPDRKRQIAGLTYDPPTPGGPPPEGREIIQVNDEALRNELSFPSPVILPNLFRRREDVDESRPLEYYTTVRTKVSKQTIIAAGFSKHGIMVVHQHPTMKNTLKTPLKYLTNDHAEGCMANLQTLKRERNFLKEDGTEDKDAKKRFAKSLNEFPNVHLGITTAQPGVGPDTAHLGRVLEAADDMALLWRDYWEAAASPGMTRMPKVFYIIFPGYLRPDFFNPQALGYDINPISILQEVNPTCPVTKKPLSGLREVVLFDQSIQWIPHVEAFDWDIVSKLDPRYRDQIRTTWERYVDEIPMVGAVRLMTELWKDTFSNHKAIGFGFHGSDVIVELKAQTKKGGELQENMSGSLTTIHHWYEMNWLGN